MHCHTHVTLWPLFANWVYFEFFCWFCVLNVCPPIITLKVPSLSSWISWNFPFTFTFVFEVSWRASWILRISLVENIYNIIQEQQKCELHCLFLYSWRKLIYQIPFPTKQKTKTIIIMGSLLSRLWKKRDNHTIELELESLKQKLQETEELLVEISARHKKSTRTMFLIFILIELIYLVVVWVFFFSPLDLWSSSKATIIESGSPLLVFPIMYRKQETFRKMIHWYFV